MFLNLKVRTKLLSIVATVAVLFAATVFVLGLVAQKHVVSTMNIELERSQMVITEFMASRWKQLDAGLNSLVDSPEIHAVLTTEGLDHETRLTSITDLQHMLGVDAVLYCDDNGKTLARTDDPFDVESIVADNPMIHQALQGTTSEGFWTVQGQTLLAMAFSVKQDGIVKGVVLAGLDIRDEGYSLRMLLQRDVVIFRQGEVLTSSFPSDESLDVSQFLNQPDTVAKRMSELTSLPRVAAGRGDGETMAAVVTSKLGPDELVKSIVLIPVSFIFGFYHDFRWVLFLMGASTIGLSVLIAFSVGAQIAEQMRKTLGILERVASGDLSARLDIKSRDEFGSIARSLNTAIDASSASLDALATRNQEMNVLLGKVEQVRSERAKLYEELIVVARQAGMAEVATDVLHNVGNVLNSVNVSAQVVAGMLKANRADGLVRVCGLIDQNRESLGEFLANDSRGKKLPEFLHRLAETLVRENQVVLVELAHLLENIEHIKQIVSMQQSLAKTCSMFETFDLAHLFENAERMNDSSLVRHAVHVYRDYSEGTHIFTDKHKVLQVLVNLIKNAKQAVCAASQADRWIRLSIELRDPATVIVRVSDNGVGISTENFDKMFTHGFTTKETGHGFGLHSSALTAKELGGKLSVHSAGKGLGGNVYIGTPHRCFAIRLESVVNGDGGRPHSIPHA